MFTIIYMLLGSLSLAAGSGILGKWLRRHPSRTNAERSSRVMHFLFFAGMIAPQSLALFRPGLAHFDERVGLSPLPARNFFRALGILLALPGFYLLIASNQSLRAQGSGANAFRLTKRLVRGSVYEQSRNPMSLGGYLVWTGTGLFAGSSFLTLYALLGVVPAHLLFLRYFEEQELELRFGKAYLEYKRSVPFLFPRLAIEREPAAARVSNESQETGESG